MLSIKRIEKLTETGHFGQLIREVAANGRPINPTDRSHLNDPRTLKPAAIGLGIRRITELSFTLSPTTRKLLNLLLQYQQDTGSFGSITATEIALQALQAVRNQGGTREVQPTLDQAIKAAEMWLKQQQNEPPALAS